MYEYIWDQETGGLLLTTNVSKFSKEPRPVYYKELDILGFDEYWNYPKDDSAPLMWAEANNYIYFGRNVAKTKGGSLYTKPEIVILDEPEPNGEMLRYVNVPLMCEKNRNILETLVQETIQKIYNTYMEYRPKIDIYYVAFSGGKDSVVTLDLVQRALPHDSFMVLFGDTQMEFSDTYDVVDKIEKKCIENNIRFERAKSQYTPEYTWNTIGPPAQRMRWCCSVHKTAPQILLLRKITDNPHFRGMAIMGVRAEESVTRSKYDQLNLGTKHQGQYDYYPILNWSSAELFLYIYQEKLIMNETYKKGNSRAGCLVCPMEAPKNSWFKSQSYSGDSCDIRCTSFYFDVIKNKTFAHELSEDKYKEFMNIGVWKSRHNGTKLSSPYINYYEERKGNNFVIIIYNISTDWKEWFKTIGNFVFEKNLITLYCDNTKYFIELLVENNKHTFTVLDVGTTQKDIYFLSWLKTVLKKSAYCIKCQICEANCPNGFIHMTDDFFYIDDNCTKCKKCYKVDNGCVVATSNLQPKENNKMNGSIDQYKNMGIRFSWVSDYLEEKDSFWESDKNDLGSQMISSLKAFLRHANITEKNKLTPFGEKIASYGADSVEAWALMICNLVYTPQFNWWIMNIRFDHIYTATEIKDMLEGVVTSNSIKNLISGYKNIFDTNKYLSSVLGVGIVTTDKKGKNTVLVSAKRSTWQEPIPEVILYSLYKFAEACDGYYQFSLSTLMDDSIERNGISPTRIFGLDREKMIAILNNLSTHYPEYIHASFTLDLETITLKDEKTSDDIINLF